MTKKDLQTLLQLADLARSTGQISFEAMADVYVSVYNADKLFRSMDSNSILTPVQLEENKPAESKQNK